MERHDHQKSTFGAVAINSRSRALLSRLEEAQSAKQNLQVRLATNKSKGPCLITGKEYSILSPKCLITENCIPASEYF